MLKIVKSSRVYNQGETVAIDNTVKFPPPPEMSEDDDSEFTSQLEIIRKQQEEEEKKLEEKRRIDEEVLKKAETIKAELERKHTEAMNALSIKQRQILEDARHVSESVIKNANEEAVKIKEKAKEEGYREGLKEGRTNGYKESIDKCQNYVETSAQFLASINQKKEAYFATYEDSLIDVVSDMVKKITLNELRTDKDTLYRILKQAAKKFKNDKSIKISFAQGDVSEELVTDIDFLKTVVGNIPDIDIEILPDASEGTVIIDNGSEIIDASVPTQLDLLKEIMNNTRGSKKTSENK